MKKFLRGAVVSLILFLVTMALVASLWAAIVGIHEHHPQGVWIILKEAK